MNKKENYQAIKISNKEHREIAKEGKNSHLLILRWFIGHLKSQFNKYIALG